MRDDADALLRQSLETGQRFGIGRLIVEHDHFMTRQIDRGEKRVDAGLQEIDAVAGRNQYRHFSARRRTFDSHGGQKRAEARFDLRRDAPRPQMSLGRPRQQARGGNEVEGRQARQKARRVDGRVFPRRRVLRKLEQAEQIGGAAGRRIAREIHAQGEQQRAAPLFQQPFVIESRQGDRPFTAIRAQQR